MKNKQSIPVITPPKPKPFWAGYESTPVIGKCYTVQNSKDKPSTVKVLFSQETNGEMQYLAMYIHTPTGTWDYARWFRKSDFLNIYADGDIENYLEKIKQSLLPDKEAVPFPTLQEVMNNLDTFGNPLPQLKLKDFIPTLSHYLEEFKKDIQNGK